MGTILVVDDEPRIRQMLQQVLACQGHRVMHAGNGVEALLAMEMRIPDLLLLDMAMPEMDGITFLRMMRQTPEWESIPVILLSGFATMDQLFTAKELRCTEQLTKADFSIRDLRARVARNLAPVALSA